MIPEKRPRNRPAPRRTSIRLRSVTGIDVIASCRSGSAGFAYGPEIDASPGEGGGRGADGKRLGLPREPASPVVGTLGPKGANCCVATCQVTVPVVPPLAPSSRRSRRSTCRLPGSAPRRCRNYQAPGRANVRRTAPSRSGSSARAGSGRPRRRRRCNSPGCRAMRVGRSGGRRRAVRGSGSSRSCPGARAPTLRAGRVRERDGAALGVLLRAECPAAQVHRLRVHAGVGHGYLPVLRRARIADRTQCVRRGQQRVANEWGSRRGSRSTRRARLPCRSSGVLRPARQPGSPGQWPCSSGSA